jgi:acyl carrier protein
VAEQVAAAVRGVLGADVGSDEPLMDAGLDSLGAVELRNALERAVGVDLPGTLVFDYPSARALASFLAAQLGGDEAALAEAETGALAASGRHGGRRSRRSSCGSGGKLRAAAAGRRGTADAGC